MRRFVAIVVALLVALPLAGVALAAITGTAGNDTLTGTPADDTIYGRAGNDTIAGAAGNDTLDGGAGADDLRGDAGQDAATYPAATAPVRVTLDNEADDGVAGEGDNVHDDVEDVYGGGGGDTLTGSDAANTLDGGAGNDTLVGGAGVDGLYGGDGDDTVNARDNGVDTVDCGPGTDTYIVDRDDVVTGCEKRARPPRVVGTLSALFDVTTTSAAFRRLAVRDISEDDATVELRCTGKGCPVKFRTFSVPDGTVPLDLSKLFKGRRLRPGAVIEVRILAAGRIGKVQRLTVARKKVVGRSLCIDPGAPKPGPC